jgi:hypothetical protein
LTDINFTRIDLSETSVNNSVDIFNGEAGTEVAVGHPADGAGFAGFVFFLTAAGRTAAWGAAAGTFLDFNLFVVVLAGLAD